MGGVRRIPRRASRSHNLKSSPKTAASKGQRGLRHVRLSGHTASAAFRPSMTSEKHHRSEGGRPMPAPFFLKGMPETLAAGLTPCPKAPCRSSGRAPTRPRDAFSRAATGSLSTLRSPRSRTCREAGIAGSLTAVFYRSDRVARFAAPPTPLEPAAFRRR